MSKPRIQVRTPWSCFAGMSPRRQPRSRLDEPAVPPLGEPDPVCTVRAGHLPGRTARDASVRRHPDRRNRDAIRALPMGVASPDVVVVRCSARVRVRLGLAISAAPIAVHVVAMVEADASRRSAPRSTSRLRCGISFSSRCCATTRAPAPRPTTSRDEHTTRAPCDAPVSSVATDETGADDLSRVLLRVRLRWQRSRTRGPVRYCRQRSP